MAECAEALKANEAAIGSDQAEYQTMLKNAFAAMLERLHAFFGESVSVHKNFSFFFFSSSSLFLC